MGADKDESHGSLYGLLAVVAKYVLGPVVAAILAWGFAVDRTDQNHRQSSRGYHRTAQVVNGMLARIELLEIKVERLEDRLLQVGVPTTQPVAHVPINLARPPARRAAGRRSPPPAPSASPRQSPLPMELGRF